MKPRKLSKRRLPAWRNRLWFYRLRKLGACEEAVVAHKRFRTFKAAWDKCERGDWMLWIAAKAGLCSRQELVLAACACARTALPHTTDPRVLKCIETTEAWAREERGVTLEQVRVAAYALSSTLYLSSYAYSASYSAASAAAYTANSSASASAAAAYSAARSASYAAARAYAASYAAALKESARIVRTMAASGGWKMVLPREIV